MIGGVENEVSDDLLLIDCFQFEGFELFAVIDGVENEVFDFLLSIDCFRFEGFEMFDLIVVVEEILADWLNLIDMEGFEIESLFVKVYEWEFDFLFPIDIFLDKELQQFV